MEIIDMDFNFYTFASTDIDMMLGVATCVLAFLVVKVSNCIIYSGSGSDSGSDSDSDSGSNSDSGFEIVNKKIKMTTTFEKQQERDLEYENNNIGFDCQCPEEDGG